MEGNYYDDARQALDETPDVPPHLRLVESLAPVEPCEPVRDGEEQ
jgi:hypothetical protein